MPFWRNSLAGPFDTAQAGGASAGDALPDPSAAQVAIRIDAARLRW